PSTIFLIIAVYFFLVLTVAFLAMRKANRSTLSGYFPAWSNHDGYAVAAWEIKALLLLQLLGWVFIPIYIQSDVCTMPEYLCFFAILTLVLYIVTKMSVNLYTGALFNQKSIRWNLYLSIIFLISMTALLAVTGGLVAVIYTDAVQALLMVAGALALTVRVRGFEVCASVTGCSNVAFPRLVMSVTNQKAVILVAVEVKPHP
uniref:Uncharacterized protein n=1 Tax=Gouania willdenowi TaxID=441366 RepID=A0A8C5G4H6_GOUWI